MNFKSIRSKWLASVAAGILLASIPSHLDASRASRAVSVSDELALSSEEVTVECTFADGALTAIVPSESEYIDDMAFTIQLLEDGSMSIATSFLDEPMVFYMTAEAIQE